MALNYRAFAVMDDGTCIHGGCRDSRAPEYDATADYDDGSCSVVIDGCTDSRAYNYRAIATHEDGSCSYVGCLDSRALNFDPSATLPGPCTAVVVGCTDPSADNHYPDANMVFDSFSGAQATCEYIGCTDSTRANCAHALPPPPAPTHQLQPPALRPSAQTLDYAAHPTPPRR